MFVLTNLLRVPPALAGGIFLAGLVLDAVLDIVVGTLAGRGERRGGRYGAFIMLGAPATGAAFVMLYSLPMVGSVAVSAVAAAALLFRGLYSIADVPHNAMIGLLTNDSQSRTRIASYRYLFSTISSLLIACTVPSIIISPNDYSQLHKLSIAAAGISVITLWVAWIVNRRFLINTRTSIRKGTGDVICGIINDADAKLLLIALVLTGLGPAAFGRGFLYYSQYVANDTHILSTNLIGVAIGQFGGLPVWAWVAQRKEKATALMLSHAVAGAGFCMLWIVGPDRIEALLLCFVVGFGLAGVYMLPWAIAPDVADRVAAKVGESAEAMLFALCILVMKASIGVSAAVAGIMLQLSLYEPGVVQNITTRYVIESITFLMPLLCCAGAAVIVRRIGLATKQS
ncbi:MFS transporter [Sphingomonadaceae bacterium OTU29THOMA1]|nr:MFS transporter [Sphingomonadaceae bacterium OTU29THOMA1]